MKKLSLITCHLSILFALAFLPACKEVGPNINLRNNQNSVSDTTYVESPVAIPEMKNVVIEEFTGVRCPNCPQGHQIVQTIKTSNPNRVVSVSLHPINSLGIHYSYSQDTFENTSAQALFDHLTPIGLEPAAAVDRIPSTGSSVLWDKSVWTTKVNSELALTTPVNLLLSKTYDSISRELTVFTELHYTQAITDESKMTVILTESDITSAQLNGSVIDTFYTHNDVQRAFISDIQGDLIPLPNEAGRVVIKVYKITLATKWKPENMHILAYVHKYQTDKTVYQAKEISVQ